MGSKELRKRIVTPFLKEARDGDPQQELLLRIAIAHGITDISQFKTMSTQELAKRLESSKGENLESELVPLTQAELEEQARMRRWLPKEKKYAKTKRRNE